MTIMTWRTEKKTAIVHLTIGVSFPDVYITDDVYNNSNGKKTNLYDWRI
jgi:hypothetical protein